eukprot:1138866-Pelagomonas_calceolata.AAC.11
MQVYQMQPSKASGLTCSNTAQGPKHRSGLRRGCFWEVPVQATLLAGDPCLLLSFPVLQGLSSTFRAFPPTFRAGVRVRFREVPPIVQAVHQGAALAWLPSTGPAQHDHISASVRCAWRTLICAGLGWHA